jgi:hypothetical protein
MGTGTSPACGFVYFGAETIRVRFERAEIPTLKKGFDNSSAQREPPAEATTNGAVATRRSGEC